MLVGAVEEEAKGAHAGTSCHVIAAARRALHGCIEQASEWRQRRAAAAVERSRRQQHSSKSVPTSSNAQPITGHVILHYPAARTLGWERWVSSCARTSPASEREPEMAPAFSQGLFPRPCSNACSWISPTGLAHSLHGQPAATQSPNNAHLLRRRAARCCCTGTGACPLLPVLPRWPAAPAGAARRKAQPKDWRHRSLQPEKYRIGHSGRARQL